MERIPINDVEIKYLMKNTLIDDINSRKVYKKTLITVIIKSSIPPLKRINCKIMTVIIVILF